MSDIKLLVGSLSNDLFRVAALKARNSDKAAKRFMVESKRWSSQLIDNDNVAEYIRKIAVDVNDGEGELSLELAEKYLMYGVLLCIFS